MKKFKTFPRGQRKEFNLRVFNGLLTLELKKLYKQRQYHEKTYTKDSKDTIIAQARYCQSLCNCVNRALQDFIAEHENDYIFPN